MPRYDVVCPVCGPREIVARISEAASFMPCDVCGVPRPQVIHAPQFTEDRVRLWRGVNGGRYSYALGGEMPDSRQARDRIAASKGVEFVGKSEFLASNKEAAEAVAYHDHVQSGGKREDPRPASAPAWQAKPAWAKALNV